MQRIFQKVLSDRKIVVFTDKDVVDVRDPVEGPGGGTGTLFCSDGSQVRGGGGGQSAHRYLFSSVASLSPFFPSYYFTILFFGRCIAAANQSEVKVGGGFEGMASDFCAR